MCHVSCSLLSKRGATCYVRIIAGLVNHRKYMNDHAMQWFNVAMPLERCQRKGLLWSPEPAMAWAPRSPSSLPVKFPSMRLSLLPGKFGQTPRNLFFVFCQIQRKAAWTAVRDCSGEWRCLGGWSWRHRRCCSSKSSRHNVESLSQGSRCPGEQCCLCCPHSQVNKKPNHPGSPESSLTR